MVYFMPGLPNPDNTSKTSITPPAADPNAPPVLPPPPPMDTAPLVVPPPPLSTNDVLSSSLNMMAAQNVASINLAPAAEKAVAPMMLTSAQAKSEKQINETMLEYWKVLNKQVQNSSNKGTPIKNIAGTAVDFLLPVTGWFGVKPQGVAGKLGHAFIQQQNEDVTAMINGTRDLATIHKAAQAVKQSGWGNCSECTSVAIDGFLEMIAAAPEGSVLKDATIHWEYRSDGHRYAVANVGGLEFIIDRWGDYCGPRNDSYPKPTDENRSPDYGLADYNKIMGK